MNRLADLVRKKLEDRSTKAQPERGLQKNQAIFADTLTEEKVSDDNAFKSHTALLASPLVKTSVVLESIPMVGTACLELSPIPLSEQIYEFGTRVAAAGAKELKLLPIFLMRGVHVKEDIPEEVETARTLLSENTIKLTLCPHLGNHSKIDDTLANRLSADASTHTLLVAHGSRRPKGNQAIKRLGERLNVPVAYWSTPPDIETQVISLMQKGGQKITILPYFLFPGGITDAITHRTEELAERFPSVEFRLLPTLGATEEVANLTVELCLSEALPNG